MARSDLHPTTTVSKILTMVYVFAGAGVFVAFISKVTAHRRRHSEDHEGEPKEA